MKLNTLAPNDGARPSRVRVGRGKGSGCGKTSRRGQKGQKARNTVPAGFEGGQMPLHRRVPKFGFTSWRARVSEEIRLSTLEKMTADVIDLDALKAADLVPNATKFAKVILSGELKRAVTVKGLKVTKGAKEAIEKAGGKVEE